MIAAILEEKHREFDPFIRAMEADKWMPLHFVGHQIDWVQKGHYEVADVSFEAVNGFDNGYLRLARWMPYQLAVERAGGNIVELISYPWLSKEGFMINARTVPYDPTTLATFYVRELRIKN